MATKGQLSSTHQTLNDLYSRLSQTLASRGTSFSVGGVVGSLWGAYAGTVWPAAGFVATFVLSAFKGSRAAQVQAQEAVLTDRKINVETSKGADLSAITNIVSELLKSLPRGSLDLSEHASSESEESKLLRQLQALERYQQGQTTELSQALEKIKELKDQVQQLSEKAQSHSEDQQQSVLVENSTLSQDTNCGSSARSGQISEIVTSLPIEPVVAEPEESQLLKQLQTFNQNQTTELSQALEKIKMLEAQVQQLSEKARLQDKKLSEATQNSILFKEKEEHYLQQIKSLENQLRLAQEETSLQNAAAANYSDQLEFSEKQIAQLKEMVQSLSESGARSSSAPLELKDALMGSLNFHGHSRGSSLEGSNNNSALNSPSKLPFSPPLTPHKVDKKTQHQDS